MPQIRLNKRMKPLNLLESMNPQLPNRNCLINLMFKTGFKKAAFLLGFILIINLFNVKLAAGQIEQRVSATTGTSTSASVTVKKPTSLVAGDIIIANIANYLSNATQISATATGWTLIVGSNIERGSDFLIING